MRDIRHRLLATFQVEHRDHVEQIRSLLAMAERAAGQPGDAIEEALRRAHSLKGAARAVDLGPVERLAHRLETLFSRVREGVLPLSPEVNSEVQQALNASEDCVAALGEKRPLPDFETPLAALDRLLGVEEPSADEGSAPSSGALLGVSSFQPLDVVRISARNFDGMLRSAGDLIAESRRQSQVTVWLKGIVQEISGIEKDAENLRCARTSSRMRPDRQTESSRLDRATGPLQRRLRALSRDANVAHRLQRRSAWNLGRLARQLQQDVWQARMTPAENLLEGLRKTVRDLARDTSKAVEFQAASSAVHADRRVLDALKDPLLHLLRNAVSHGIETPEERVAKGKPRAGTVTLSIASRGQQLTISVEDDGRGVDLVRVAEVAGEQGILPAGAPPAPGDLTSILFRPGFSTCQAVTELSGRGMGLSVVYEAVRCLHGEVDLRTRDGAGTSFHLSVPLSIATHRLLLVACGGQWFALPLHGIERLLRIRLRSVETIEGKPVVVAGSQPVPLFALRQLLGLETGASEAPASGMLPVAIVRAGSNRAAIAVDEFLWETDAVIQDLGPAAPDGGKVSGGVVLDDGRIALVLDLMALPKSGGEPAWPSFTPTAETKPRAAPSVLVVDDSMTTRTLEKSILEANGYRVRVAVDGMDALDQLRSEKADLVVTDIQMPRMDGFDLLEAMKSDSGLNRIPVVVVTSLDRREDRSRGLQLGADAYIVKRKFDQEELLAAIRQIL